MTSTPRRGPRHEESHDNLEAGLHVRARQGKNPRRLIAPGARGQGGEATDYGRLVHDYGLHDILFIEPQALLTAGELALNILTKAHRLAKGWSIRWPFFAGASEKGLTEAEIRRSAMPESLDGLTGAVNCAFPFVEISLPDVESASFIVKVDPV